MRRAHGDARHATAIPPRYGARKCWVSVEIERDRNLAQKWNKVKEIEVNGTTLARLGMAGTASRAPPWLAPPAAVKEFSPQETVRL